MRKLFLTSSTITPNLVEEFEALVGKPIEGLKAAFIPDAAYSPLLEGTDRSWVEEEKAELVENYRWKITDLLMEKADKGSLDILHDQDVIYVNGGLSGHLAKMMRRCGFDKLLPELLARGILYVGSSAGSMVMSDVQDASSWYLGEPEPEAISIPGLGYIDFQIYPHITDEKRASVKNACNKGYTYYLMEDGSAIMINGDKMKVLGEVEIFEV